MADIRSRGNEDTPAPGRKPAAWVVPVGAFVCVVLALLLAFGGFLLYVSEMGTIYPHVLLDGVYVGGLTPMEAAQLLENRGEQGYNGKSVTVELPMGESLTVTAEQVGLGGSPASAARAAYDYGRQGNVLENAWSYLCCLRGQGVNILWRGSVDTEALAALTEAAAEPLNRRLDSAGAEIGEDSVSFTKGAGALTVDSQALSDRIGLAFAGENYETIVYEPVLDGQANVELENLYDELYRPAKDASFDKETGEILPEEPGLSFDMEEAERLLDQAANGQTVTIPLVRTEPEITGEILEGYLFRDLLVEKSTSLSGSSSERINNVTLAARAMDGTVLLPGEEFNYNDCLGERTSAAGYQAAGVYENGRYSTGIGGGICQNSSTLYYCALYANLKITERTDHYFPVSYLPMGLDATVSWYAPNFRFVNSRDYPIRIDAWVEGGYLTVQLWGTDLDGSYVEVSTEGWEDAEYYYAMSYRRVYAADGTLLVEEDGVYSRYHKYEKTDEE